MPVTAKKGNRAKTGIQALAILFPDYASLYPSTIIYQLTDIQPTDFVLYYYSLYPSTIIYGNNY